MTAPAHSEHHHDQEHREGIGTASAVLEVSGVQWATSKSVAEAVLSRRPGVHSVDANPVAQTATVIYDPNLTNLTELRDWVRECGSTAPASRFPSTSATR